ILSKKHRVGERVSADFLLQKTLQRPFSNNVEMCGNSSVSQEFHRLDEHINAFNFLPSPDKKKICLCRIDFDRGGRDILGERPYRGKKRAGPPGEFVHTVAQIDTIGKQTVGML